MRTYNIQGIGANFVPKTLDRSLIDEIITVPDEEAFVWAREMGKTEGILTGNFFRSCPLCCFRSCFKG